MTPDVIAEATDRNPQLHSVRQSAVLSLHAHHNYCLNHARGEYLCLWHDHDLHDWTLIRRYVEFLDAHPSVGAVCADWDVIGPDGLQLIRDFKGPSIQPGQQYITQTIRSGRSSLALPGTMIRMAALRDIRFDETAPTGYSDFPIWFRIAEQWDIGHIKERLWSLRWTPDAQSTKSISVMMQDYEANVGGYIASSLSGYPFDCGDAMNPFVRMMRRLICSSANTMR